MASSGSSVTSAGTGTGAGLADYFSARQRAARVAPPATEPLWGGRIAEPSPPSIEISKQRLEARLPRDPSGRPHLDVGRAPHLADFEALGLSVYSYISHLHRLRFFFMMLSLLSVSSMVANGYGSELRAANKVELVPWLFSGTSLGNAAGIAPAYGATELLISSLMTLFLFWAGVRTGIDRTQ